MGKQKDVGGRDKPGHDEVERLSQRAECLAQVVPIGIGCKDQTHLRGARPMLHVLPALNSVNNPINLLKADQAFEAVSLREPVGQALAMLPDSPGQIRGDTT